MDRVRDNTSRQGLGIGMSKGEMQAFQAAFVAADKNLDERVCKGGSNGGDKDKKCETPTGSEETDKTTSENNLGYAYKAGGLDKVEPTEAGKMATSISKLGKGEEKAFHTTFKAADNNLDEKVCKNGSGTGSNEKCDKAETSKGLEEVYEGEKIAPEAGPNIATSISKLGKEEKATLAGAFAKGSRG